MCGLRLFHIDFGFTHSSRKLSVYDSDGLLSHVVLDAHFSTDCKYPLRISGAKFVRNDLENSTISGEAFFWLVLGLPYLYTIQ